MFGFFNNKKNKLKETLLNELLSQTLLNEIDRKKNVEVLYIDDEYYDKVEVLKANQIRVTYLRDSDNPLISVAFNIVLIDISQVATERGESEGIGLAIDIKKNFPEKKVFLYSMHTDKIRQAYSDIEKESTKYLETTGYRFIGVLDKQGTRDDLLASIKAAIDDLNDPEYTWKHIKYRFVVSGITNDKIEKIERAYRLIKTTRSLSETIELLEEKNIDKQALFDTIKIMAQVAQFVVPLVGGKP